MKAEWTNKDNLSIETTSQNSKAVLVIDMPTHCGECPVKCRMRGINHVPTWCPLRPLPSKLVPFGYLDAGNEDGLYEKGYNDCIDEIAGETE